MFVRLGWRTGTGAAARKGLPREDRINVMLYALAVLSLSFMAYLALDFYNEQIRTRLVPVRSQRKSPNQRRRS